MTNYRKSYFYFLAFSHTNHTSRPVKCPTLALVHGNNRARERDARVTRDRERDRERDRARELPEIFSLFGGRASTKCMRTRA